MTSGGDTGGDVTGRNGGDAGSGNDLELTTTFIDINLVTWVLLSVERNHLPSF